MTDTFQELLHNNDISDLIEEHYDESHFTITDEDYESLSYDQFTNPQTMELSYFVSLTNQDIVQHIESFLALFDLEFAQAPVFKKAE